MACLHSTQGYDNIYNIYNIAQPIIISEALNWGSILTKYVPVNLVGELATLKYSLHTFYSWLVYMYM